MPPHILIFCLQFFKNRYTMLSAKRKTKTNYIVEGGYHGSKADAAGGDPALQQRRREGVCLCCVSGRDILADSKGNGRAVRCECSSYLQALAKHLRGGGTHPRGNRFQNGNSSRGGIQAGLPHPGALQPGCHHCRRLPGELQKGHPFPSVGHENPERVHHKGLCPQQ